MPLEDSEDGQPAPDSDSAGNDTRRRTLRVTQLKDGLLNLARRRKSAFFTDSSTAARTSSQRKVKLTSDFIKRDSEITWQDGSVLLPGPRRTLAKVLRHWLFDLLGGTIVIFDIILNAQSIDNRAAGLSAPMWLVVGGCICLGWYTLESVAWLIVRSWKAFADKWLLQDLFFVMAGYLEIFLSGVVSFDAIVLLRVLRIIRLMRLVKLFRKFSFLKELRKLVQMTASCFKTLLWSFVFCFVVMTTFAMAAVELAYPTVKELADNGTFDNCPACVRSMSSVMNANLLLFKTVIAGDSWGEVAVPVIEARPWTAIIFVGSSLTLVFGVLNLIVAVVVDTFAEQREKDVAQLAEDIEHDGESDLQVLSKVFSRIDANGNGELTLEDLMEGAKNVPEFQSRLRVMDIDEQDLEQLFSMLDLDGGGTISPDEFMVCLSRWLNESKTAVRFVKYNVHQSLIEQGEMKSAIMALNEKFDSFMKKSSFAGEEPQDPGRSTKSPFSDLEPDADIAFTSRLSGDAGERGPEKVDREKAMTFDAEALKQMARASANAILAAELLVQETEMAELEGVLLEALKRVQGPGELPGTDATAATWCSRRQRSGDHPRCSDPPAACAEPEEPTSFSSQASSGQHFRTRGPDLVVQNSCPAAEGSLRKDQHPSCGAPWHDLLYGVVV